ncbi:MAG: TRAP transporter substrate-binding protein DctP [Desulfatiglandales bacterium]|jgi:TRAP-type C4-dicarboxylate transport system substrate-binding protein|nr:TRAP transporter substrate-binding protein DctP [Desulfatiglandales bacterium]
MNKRLLPFFLTIFLAVLLVFTTQTPVTAAEGKPIVLKAVTFIPQGHPSAWGWWRYRELINEAAKGRLVLEFAGGPETISGFDQPEALRTGAIDVNYIVTAYYKTMLPEANSLHLSTLKPWEERESGFHGYMVELHKKKNIYFMGRQLFNSPFILATSKLRIERPQDLRGRKFRTAALYDAMFKKLGVTGITIPISDQYSALERGLVDGTATTPSSALKYSFNEVCKYIIGPMYYRAQNGVMLVNLDAWNRIPKDLQDLMIKTQIKVEREVWDHFGNLVGGQVHQLKERGMEFVKWSPADDKWFLDIAYQAAWGEVEKKTSRETAAQLKGMITR